MTRVIQISALIALAVPGCRSEAEAPIPMQVIEALPDSGSGPAREWGTRAQPIPLYLNSRIQVEFSEEIDLLTVTSDTVRLMKLVDDGPAQVTPMLERSLGSRSVTLLPEWPVTADLDDGSLITGQLYRLEVRGFPLTNTVRSRDGVGVEGFVRYYRTVDRDANPGPLLPVGTPVDPFKVSSSSLRMASDTRTVRLHFTLPPHPATVSPDSFDFIVIRAGREIRLAIAATRILSERRPIWEGDASSPGGQRMRWSYPASTVELRLDDDAVLQPGEFFWVHLKPSGRDRPGATSHWVRDYRGNPISLEVQQSFVMGRIFAGDMVELCRFPSDRNAPDLIQADRRKHSFEIHFDSRSHMRPLVRREAGRGQLGAFHPKQSMTLQPLVPFDRGDGVMKVCRGRFEFSSIYIPAGVTVTVQARNPVELLSVSGIRIDGTLVLATQRAQAAQGIDQTDLDAYRLRLVQDGFGVRILAAGDIHIEGSVRHLRTGDYLASPVSIVGRRLSLAQGALPRGAIVAADGITGQVQGVNQVRYTPSVGLPTAVHRAEAAAWTPWIALPADFMGLIDARWQKLDGAMEVYLQVAPPDPSDPSLPYVAAGSLPEPRKLPLRARIRVGRNSQVRFLLKAKLIAGKPLPSVDSLLILSER